MKYDLFVSDYDRTLGDKTYVDEGTISAIKKYCDMGGKFVVCSGRVVKSITDICLSYGLNGLVVSYQGAMISDLISGKVLFDGGIDKNLAKKIANDFIEKGFDVTVDIGGKRFWEKHEGLMDVYVEHGGTSGERVKSVIQAIDLHGGAIEKVCAMCLPEVARDCVPQFNEKYAGQVEFNSGSPIIIEAINPEYGKGWAIRFLSEYYKVPFEKIIAVGDSTNDISLIKGEWHGVAVGSGNEELKAVAKEITVPFDKHPVKYLLEKYCI